MDIQAIRHRCATHPLATFVIVLVLAVLLRNAMDAFTGVVPGFMLAGEVVGASFIAVVMAAVFPWELTVSGVRECGGSPTDPAAERDAFMPQVAPLSMSRLQKRRFLVVMIGVFVLVAGLVAALFTVGAQHGGSSTVLSSVGVLGAVCFMVVYCFATAVFEEGLFRGVAFPCFFKLFDKADEGMSRKGEAKFAFAAFMKAALLCGVIFGLLHLSIPDSLGSSGLQPITGGAAATLPAAASSGTTIPAVQPTFVVVIGLILRFLQTSAFGVLMAAVFVLSRTLWPCIAMHAIFDFAYFTPVALVSGVSVDRLVSQATTIPGSLLGTLAIFVILAILAICDVRRSLFMRSVSPSDTSDPPDPSTATETILSSGLSGGNQKGGDR